MLTGIERLLIAYGFRVEVFASAEAFLDGSATSEATCLVLDIGLTGMSGIELRRRLATSGCSHPVIFVTALDDDVTHKEALEAGCVAFLRKPFAGRELIDAI